MIPFNRPYMTGRELGNIAGAHARAHLSGDGHFTGVCSRWLEREVGVCRALLTHSCTAALEMAALLVEVGPGDEVIMPSHTFVSTANAFVLRGAVPVFVDVRPDTLNLDERKIEAAITGRTRAIVPVHYAGVACEMDEICSIAQRHDLWVIEDAAQAILSTYRGRPLGGIGDFGAFSFHETKNVIAGEGGALLIRDEAAVARAEIIREKGTNRARFHRGQVDKYTWVDVGSSFLPGEIVAAFLAAQMEEAKSIKQRRLRIWDRYQAAFEDLERRGRVRRPRVPAHCGHNGHMYFLILNSLEERSRMISELNARGIQCVFHYQPLHASPEGIRSGRASGDLSGTVDLANRLVRLPLWLGLEEHQDRVIEETISVLG